MRQNHTLIESAIISQYRASFKMLIDVTNKCPEDIWANTEYKNMSWQITYHTLFNAALYLSESPSKFIPWVKHIENYNYLGATAPDNRPVAIHNIYSKDEMIEYAVLLFQECENSINNSDMAEINNFDWLPLNRLEVHFYNIRHIQHHIGQLQERLHKSGILGIKWISRS